MDNRHEVLWYLGRTIIDAACIVDGKLALYKAYSFTYRCRFADPRIENSASYTIMYTNIHASHGATSRHDQLFRYGIFSDQRIGRQHVHVWIYLPHMYNCSNSHHDIICPNNSYSCDWIGSFSTSIRQAGGSRLASCDEWIFHLVRLAFHHRNEQKFPSRVSCILSYIYI